MDDSNKDRLSKVFNLPLDCARWGSDVAVKGMDRLGFIDADAQSRRERLDQDSFTKSFMSVMDGMRLSLKARVASYNRRHPEDTIHNPYEPE